MCKGNLNEDKAKPYESPFGNVSSGGTVLNKEAHVHASPGRCIPFGSAHMIQASSVYI